MTIRPEVVDALNGVRADAGETSGMDVIDLAHGATQEERAAAAATRLAARTQAGRAIKAKLADVLAGCGLTSQEAAGLTDLVTINTAAISHPVAVKITGAAGIAGPEEIRGAYGDGWAEALAGETRLPVYEVRRIYAEIAPR